MFFLWNNLKDKKLLPAHVFAGKSLRRSSFRRYRLVRNGSSFFKTNISQSGHSGAPPPRGAGYRP
jgi:hypothetical protein